MPNTEDLKNGLINFDIPECLGREETSLAMARVLLSQHTPGVNKNKVTNPEEPSTRKMPSRMHDYGVVLQGWSSIVAALSIVTRALRIDPRYGSVLTRIRQLTLEEI